MDLKEDASALLYVEHNNKIERLKLSTNFPLCCCVLQCAAVCCRVLSCITVCYSVLQRAAACCSVLRCVARHVTCRQNQCQAYYTIKVDLGIPTVHFLPYQLGTEWHRVIGYLIFVGHFPQKRPIICTSLQ